jgi:hypothetical protein
MFTFEAPLGTFTGTGVASIVDPGVHPTTILKVTDAWSVQVDWTATGNFPIPWTPGDWYVQAFLERFGPEPDLIINAVPAKVPFGGINYSVNIPKDPMLPVLPGMYRLAVSITYKDIPGDPKPTAGFQDGPTLQFYED